MRYYNKVLIMESGHPIANRCKDTVLKKLQQLVINGDARAIADVQAFSLHPDSDSEDDESIASSDVASRYSSDEEAPAIPDEEVAISDTSSHPSIRRSGGSDAQANVSQAEAILSDALFLTTSLQGRYTHMEHRQSPLDNENKRRQNLAEKPSDASPSERLQKSRNSHLIGRGINPRDWLNRQVGTDEAASSRVDKQNTTHHDTQNSLEHDTDRDPSQDENKLAERETGEKQAITTPLDGDFGSLKYPGQK